MIRKGGKDVGEKGMGKGDHAGRGVSGGDRHS